MLALVTSRSFVRQSAVRTAVTATARYNSTRLYSSTMHDNDPEVLEKEKNRVLSRNVNDKTSAPHEHAPGWNESLASASEAFVKADKSEGTKDEMQATTVEYMRARRTEDGDGSSSTTAYYTRDEVSGPLSGAQGKEEVILSKGRVAEIQTNAILKALMWEIMTPSEEAVKADRGEVLW